MTMKPTEKPFITYIPGFEGYLTTRYFTEEQGWRDRTVLHYNPNDIASVKVEVPFKTEENYLLTIKGNNQYEIKMLATNTLATNIDPLQVKQYLSYFQQQNFESFEVAINQKQIDSVLKSVPLNILTITDKKGVTNKITFYARYPLQRDLKDDNTGAPIQFDMSRMDALLNNGKDFVMLQYLAFGKILPPVDYFRKKN